MTARSSATRAATVLGLIAIVLSAAGSLRAQQRQSGADLAPEDQLAPSQMRQPMPAPVREPGGAPATRPAKPTAQNAGVAKPPESPAEPAPRKKPARPAAVRTVVACSGPFARDSGMLALAVAFDSRNMTFVEQTVQGTKVGMTVLFPKDPRRRLEVWWRNANRTGTYLIDIADKSIWSGPEGLRLGLTLPELQKINRKPFKIGKFDAEGNANVADWDSGALSSLAGGCKAGVTLHAHGKAGAGGETPEGDQFVSDDAALRPLKATVSEILIGY